MRKVLKVRYLVIGEKAEIQRATGFFGDVVRALDETNADFQAVEQEWGEIRCHVGKALLPDFTIRQEGENVVAKIGGANLSGKTTMEVVVAVNRAMDHLARGVDW